MEYIMELCLNSQLFFLEDKNIFLYKGTASVFGSRAFFIGDNPASPPLKIVIKRV